MSKSQPEKLLGNKKKAPSELDDAISNSNSNNTEQKKKEICHLCENETTNFSKCKKCSTCYCMNCHKVNPGELNICMVCSLICQCKKCKQNRFCCLCKANNGLIKIGSILNKIKLLDTKKQEVILEDKTFMMLFKDPEEYSNKNVCKNCIKINSYLSQLMDDGENSENESIIGQNKLIDDIAKKKTENEQIGEIPGNNNLNKKSNNIRFGGKEFSYLNNGNINDSFLPPGINNNTNSAQNFINSISKISETIISFNEDINSQNLDSISNLQSSFDQLNAMINNNMNIFSSDNKEDIDKKTSSNNTSEVEQIKRSLSEVKKQIDLMKTYVQMQKSVLSYTVKNLEQMIYNIVNSPLLPEINNEPHKNYFINNPYLLSIPQAPISFSLPMQHLQVPGPNQIGLGIPMNYPIGLGINSCIGIPNIKGPVSNIPGTVPNIPGAVPNIQGPTIPGLNSNIQSQGEKVNQSNLNQQNPSQGQKTKPSQQTAFSPNAPAAQIGQISAQIPAQITCSLPPQIGTQIPIPGTNGMLLGIQSSQSGLPVNVDSYILEMNKSIQDKNIVRPQNPINIPNIMIPNRVMSLNDQLQQMNRPGEVLLSKSYHPQFDGMIPSVNQPLQNFGMPRDIRIGGFPNEENIIGQNEGYNTQLGLGNNMNNMGFNVFDEINNPVPRTKPKNDGIMKVLMERNNLNPKDNLNKDK